jgi:hypothetical protein
MLGLPPTTTKFAATVPPEPLPATVTDAPSVTASSSGPDAFILVVAVVVTVTDLPPGIAMTTLSPSTRSSVPVACSSLAQPVTAVSVAVLPVPSVPGPFTETKLATPYPAKPTRTAAAAASISRRRGVASIRRTGWAGRTGWATSGVAAMRPRTPPATRLHRSASRRHCSHPARCPRTRSPVASALASAIRSARSRCGVLMSAFIGSGPSHRGSGRARYAPRTGGSSPSRSGSPAHRPPPGG